MVVYFTYGLALCDAYVDTAEKRRNEGDTASEHTRYVLLSNQICQRKFPRLLLNRLIGNHFLHTSVASIIRIH